MKKTLHTFLTAAAFAASMQQKPTAKFQKATAPSEAPEKSENKEQSADSNAKNNTES